MVTAFLRVRSPFARFGMFTDGYHVPTYPTWTPTAALGLVGALLGLDINQGDHLPPALIALGIPVGTVSEIGVLLHQWHNYPKSGGADAKTADGEQQYQKMAIGPNRVEYVCDCEAVIAVQKVDFEALRSGIETGPPLYAGASDLLIDHLEWIDPNQEVRWWQPVAASQRLVPGLQRMRTRLHRRDSAQSRSVVLHLGTPAVRPPNDAWLAPEIHI